MCQPVVDTRAERRLPWTKMVPGDPHTPQTHPTSRKDAESIRPNSDGGQAEAEPSIYIVVGLSYPLSDARPSRRVQDERAMRSHSASGFPTPSTTWAVLRGPPRLLLPDC